MTAHPREAAGLLLAAGLAAAGCSRPASSAPAPATRGVPVRAAAVERRNLEEVLLLTGTLRPRAQVALVAEVGARLVRVLKDEGARVGRSEVVALLDDKDYRLGHERARAALAEAEASRAHAQVEKERADNLLKTGGITDKDHLAAGVGLQLAEAALGRLRAEAAIAAEQLARCSVKAPFAGRLARRHADPGAMLVAGAPVFTLVDDAVLEFRAAVPSSDFARVKVGAAVQATVDALPGATFTGRVARLTPLIDERTRSFEVVVEVPGSDSLVGGLFARAAVAVGRVEGALVVPPSALVRDGGGPGEAFVFAVVDGRAERRAVELGVETPQAVQVSKGLLAGDTVVLDPPVALGSGSPVELARR